MMKRDDLYFMCQALKEAEKAGRENEVPVGAVIVSGGNILSRAYNQCVSLNDPTAHAEILAIREACQVRGDWRLNDCDLYVTLEPCPMCTGAVVLSRLRRLVYGADDPKGGGVRSVIEFPFEKTNHIPQIRRGLLSEECGRILKDFFISKR